MQCTKFEKMEGLSYVLNGSTPRACHLGHHGCIVHYTVFLSWYHYVIKSCEISNWADQLARKLGTIGVFHQNEQLAGIM